MQDVVQIVFVSGSQFLLAFRQNTDALDQLWGFPSGRIERGELAIDAAIREAHEEVSVITDNLELLATLIDEHNSARHYFYLCKEWSGKIQNSEPSLCRELRWFSLNDFPKDCTPITYVAMEHLKGLSYDPELRT